MKSYSQTIILQNDNFRCSSKLCLVIASLIDLQKEKLNFLHNDEIIYLDSLSFDKRRYSYLLGRYAAKKALVDYFPQLLPTNILIKAGIFGNPISYYPNYEKTQITVSHSDFLGAALAFPAGYLMGIDIEAIESRHQTSIETQLITAEIEWINQQKSMPSPILYTLFWTIKEALSKTLFTGTTCPFEIYAIKNIVYYQHYWISEFVNFTQYKALSVLIGKQIFSIVYPKQVKLILNIDDIQKWRTAN